MALLVLGILKFSRPALMPQKTQKIPVKGYGIESQDYFRRGRRNINQLKQTGHADWFFYTALEFRNCIERLLYEYLVLIGHKTWSKSREKKYRATDLKGEILRIEPEFDQKLEFASLHLQAIGSPGIYLIDLDELNELYGRLGNFLHACKRPEKTSENPRWWGRLHEAICEADAALLPVYQHAIAHIELSEDGWDMYEKWKKGEVTDKEVMTDFRRALMSNSPDNSN